MALFWKYSLFIWTSIILFFFLKSYFTKVDVHTNLTCPVCPNCDEACPSCPKNTPINYSTCPSTSYNTVRSSLENWVYSPRVEDFPFFNLVHACPSWLTQYRLFHQKHRGKREDERYLVARCDGGCGGMGDRLRGALFLLRIAAAFNRVLIIEWTHPIRLEKVLAPAEIDWTINGIEDLIKRRGVKIKAIDPPYIAFGKWNRLKGVFGDVYRDAIVHIQTNAFSNLSFILDSKLQTQPLIRRKEWGSETYHPINMYSAPNSCLINFVFAAGTKLKELIAIKKKEIFGTTLPNPYISVHVRTGGELVKWSDPSRYDIIQSKKIVECAFNVRRIMGFPNNASILLITDSDSFRSDMFYQYHEQGLYISDNTLKHTDRSPGNVDIHMGEFVDFALLSQGSCIIYGESGFGQWAASWGNIQCAYHANDCFKGIIGFY